MAALLAIACGCGSRSGSGSGGGGGLIGGGGSTPPSTSGYAVGGSVTGMRGTLVLQNNDGDDLTVSADGTFTFSTRLGNRAAYYVTVATLPAGQNCYVVKGYGYVYGADVTDVQVACGDKGTDLSGSVAVPQGVLTDSDVNDVNEPYVSNDTIGTAQPIPNPIAIGGYVNRPRAGASGRSYGTGDVDDYFQVQLKAGDAISLAVGEPIPLFNDLDLYLYDSAGVLQDSSVGSGAYEILHAPADGTYFVNVYAYAGASNYILTIGTDAMLGMSANAPTLSSQSEIVPDQVIVRLKDTAEAAQAQAAGTASAQEALSQFSAMGLQAVSGATGREMLLAVEDADALEASITAGASTQGAAGKAFKALSGREGGKQGDPEKARKLQTIQAIKALRQRSDVAAAEPNYILRGYGVTPDDAYYVRQWHYPMINLPEAWAQTKGSDNVVVAVIDTGVLKNHPDLQNRLTGTGYDFVDGDSDPDDPGDGSFGASSSFHGTHVAGTIAAQTGNASGVAGVTWQTKVMPVRVLGKGGAGTSYDIRQGIRYAAGMDNDSGAVPAHHADIINLSLGGESYDSLDKELLDQVRAKGIVVVAAAGNSATNRPSYPAAYDGVVSVSAVDVNGTKASYSNYGATIDIAAPGGNSGDLNGDGYSDGVLSTGGDDSSGTITFTYKTMYGTSMASPHVAGVVALMKAVHPGLTPDDLDALIATGKITDDIGAAGRDDSYGYGLVNALKAVTAAHEVAGGMAITGMNATPRSVNFGIGNSIPVTVSKIGSGALSITGVVASDAWLTVTPVSADANGFGGYRFDANRSPSMQDGAYTATVTFTASSGDVMVISVSMLVRSTSPDYDAGRHYMVLLRVGEGDEMEVVDMDEGSVSGGYYTYSFRDVVPGRYRIFAGSDRDNDGYLADEGEALGAYPTLDQILDLDVAAGSASMGNLDFPTDLHLAIESTESLASGGGGGATGATNVRAIPRRLAPATGQ
jgi:serine protease